MFKELTKVERRFLEIENLLSRPDVMADYVLFRALGKERSELEVGVRLFRDYKKCQQETTDTEALLKESNGEMAMLAQEEILGLKARMTEIEKSLHLFLLPKDPNDGRNILLEIRAGAGGDEASLFAAELFRMYTRYCERQKWRIEVLSLSENELNGFKEVIALIEGENVFQALKFESGVHRVQRVPQTEAQGRIHTSTVTVAILPEADDVEVDVNDADIRVDTFRASGAGGQHVNRTDSAVRLTHNPSGIVVQCQDERSQIKNRAKAMKILKSKLLERAQEEQDRSISEERRSQVGRGDRSERIRTYNFPQTRCTDHRINYTTHALAEVMEGGLDDLFEKLTQHYQKEALNRASRGNEDV